METNNFELFDSYMRGMLSQEELLQVESKLRIDEDFQHDYELYQLMVTAIAENRKSELKTFISNNIKVKPVPFFKTPAFFATAAASIALCILSYFVIYKKLVEQNILAQQEEIRSKFEVAHTPMPDSIGSLAEKGGSLVVQKETATNNKEDQPKQNSTVNIKEAQPELLYTTNEKQDNQAQALNESDAVATADNIKVVGDDMLFDTFLSIPRKIYIAKPEQYKSSVNDLYTVVVAGDKLRLEVQFWHSPINYNGYRLHHNLLVIYGNFDPLQASFQELKDVIFMKYKNEYYKLEATENYTSMKKETDAKRIADLDLKK